MIRKLGKKAARHDDRTLKFAKYAPPVRPPASVNWTNIVKSWGMLGNDQCGDCTFAAVAHLLQSWEENNGVTGGTPTESSVVSAYASATGYDPRTGANDNGANMLDVLNRWTDPGLFGNRLGAYAKVETQHEVQLSTWWFGGVYVGIQLPISANDQINGHMPWVLPLDISPSNEPGSWGGHCVPIVAYSDWGVTVVTWGQLQLASWGWLQVYMDEAYACLDLAWTVRGHAPNTFDFVTLQQDLASL
jgi:hypothetical protein